MNEWMSLHFGRYCPLSDIKQAILFAQQSHSESSERSLVGTKRRNEKIKVNSDNSIELACHVISE